VDILYEKWKLTEVIHQLYGEKIISTVEYFNDILKFSLGYFTYLNDYSDKLKQNHQ